MNKRGRPPGRKTGRPIHGIRASAAEFMLLQRFKKCLEENTEMSVLALKKLENNILVSGTEEVVTLPHGFE